MEEAKEGDLLAITVYVRVREPWVTGGGYWIDVPKLTETIIDAQVQRVISQEHLSKEAQIILREFYLAGNDYWPIWLLEKKLGVHLALDPRKGNTEWDRAMCELLDANIIEEVFNLPHRYHLKFTIQVQKDEA